MHPLAGMKGFNRRRSQVLKGVPISFREGYNSKPSRTRRTNREAVRNPMRGDENGFKSEPGAHYAGRPGVLGFEDVIERGGDGSLHGARQEPRGPGDTARPPGPPSAI